MIKEIFWKDLHIWVYILYCLYFVGSPCSGNMKTEQQLIYIEWHRKLLQVFNKQMDSESNRTEMTLCDWKSKLWHLFRKIPNISNYKHSALIVRNPGRVSLPEFPTSAAVYVTILSNDQVMPNVKSVKDLDSFTIIPTGLSNERASYFDYFNFVRTYILRKTCDEDARDVTCPKPLTQITKSNIVGVRDNYEPNTKKTKRNMKNTVWNYIADKNINIACLLVYYLWLSVARVDIICSHNVIFFPLIYTTIPPITNDFFSKYMYCDDIKFINVSFSSLLTNLCEKIDFDSWPPEGPFSPDGSHIYYYF